MLARYAWLDRSTALGLTLVAVGCGLSAVIGGALRGAGRGPRLRWLGAGAIVGLIAAALAMNGGWHAWLRLFAVQGTWNYERLLGVGMGYAAEPLLEDLKTVDPVRHTEAVVRSAEFFNCNPNLAGLALGATARAEYDGVPGAQIARLRTALCSPLGALGDQLFWAGLIPLLLGAAMIAIVLGAAWWAVLGFLVLYNLSRVVTGIWALRAGLEAGMGVGAAIGQSWIGKAIERVGPAAGFGMGVAVPMVGGWYLDAIGWPAAFGAVAVAATGVAVTRWFGASLTTVRFTLLALILLVLFRWLLP